VQGATQLPGRTQVVPSRGKPAFFSHRPTAPGSERTDRGDDESLREEANAARYELTPIPFLADRNSTEFGVGSCDPNPNLRFSMPAGVA
jgi:hypothetical protein